VKVKAFFAGELTGRAQQAWALRTVIEGNKQGNFHPRAASAGGRGATSGIRPFTKAMHQILALPCLLASHPKRLAPFEGELGRPRWLLAGPWRSRVQHYGTHAACAATEALGVPLNDTPAACRCRLAGSACVGVCSARRGGHATPPAPKSFRSPWRRRVRTRQKKSW
jgi:hypothetical protein